MKKPELIKLSDLPEATEIVGAELRLEPRQSDSRTPLHMRMSVCEGVFFFNTNENLNIGPLLSL